MYVSEDEHVWARAERLAIVNAYSIARSLGVGFATPYKVINAMISNPFMFGVAIPRTSDEDQIKRELREWEVLVRRLGYDPSSIAEGRFDGPAPDVERALALVRRLIATGRPCIVIYADSSHGLLHGLRSVVPRKLFGAGLGEFDGKRGYCVSWIELLRRMLNADVVAETKGTEKPAGFAKSTGSPTVDLHKQ